MAIEDIIEGVKEDDSYLYVVVKLIGKEEGVEANSGGNVKAGTLDLMHLASSLLVTCDKLYYQTLDKIEKDSDIPPKVIDDMLRNANTRLTSNDVKKVSSSKERKKHKDKNFDFSIEKK